MAIDSIRSFADLLPRMKPFEQRKYFDAIIAFMIRRYFASSHFDHEDTIFTASNIISGAADLLRTLTKQNEALNDHLVSLLTRSNLPSLDDSLAARRSVMAALAQDEGEQFPVWVNPMLTLRRQISHLTRKLHQTVRRYHVHQAHTRGTTRKYEYQLS